MPFDPYVDPYAILSTRQGLDKLLHPVGGLLTHLLGHNVADGGQIGLLFLVLFLRMLKVGGRCACIVPDGVLVFTKTGHGGTDSVWFYDMRADTG